MADGSSARVEELNNKLRTFRDRLVQRDAVVASANEAKNKALAQVERLQHEVDHHKHELKDAQKTIEAWSAKHNSMEVTYEEAKQATETFKEEIALHKKAVTQLEIERDRHLSTVNVLEVQAKEHKEDIKKHQLKHNEYEASQSLLKQDLHRLKEAHKSLSEDLVEKEKRLETLSQKEVELMSMSQEKAILLSRIEYFEGVEEKLKLVQGQANEGQIKVAQQEGKLSELQAQVERARKWERLLETAREENMSLRSKQMELDNMVVNLTRENKKIEYMQEQLGEYDALRHEKMKTDFVMEQMRVENERLKTEGERFEGIEAAMNEVRSQLVEAKARCVKFDEARQHAICELEETRKELKLKTSELSAAKEEEQKARFSAENESLRLKDARKDAHEKMTTAFRNAQNDWAREQSEFEHDIRGLEEELQTTTAVVSELRKELEQSNKMREAANRRCAQLEEQLQEKLSEMFKAKQVSEDLLIANDEKIRVRLDEEHAKMVKMQSEKYESESNAKALLAELQQEKEMRKDERERLTIANRKLAEKNEKSDAKLTSLQEEYTQAQIRWATERGHDQGNIQLLESRIEMLKHGLTEAQEGTTMAEVNMSELRRHSESWKKDQARLRTELRQYEVVKEQFEQQVMSLENDKHVLKEELDGCTRENRALQNAFADLKSASTMSIENLQETIAKNEKLIRTIEDECAKKIEQLNEEKFAYEREISLKTNDLKHLTEKFETYRSNEEQTAKHDAQKINQLKSTVEKLESKCHKLETDIKQQRVEMSHQQITFENTRTRLENTVQQLSSSKEELEGNLKSLNTKFEDKMVESVRLEEIRKSQASKVSELNARLETCMENLSAKSLEADHNLQALEANKKNMQIMLDGSQKERERLQRDLTSITQTHREEAITSRAAITKAEESLRHAKESLEKEVSRCQQELNEMKIFHKASADSWKTSLETLSLQLKEKEASLMTLQKSFDVQVAVHSKMKLRVLSQLEKAGRQVEEKKHATERLAAKAAALETSKNQALSRYEESKKASERRMKEILQQLKAAQEREESVRREVADAKRETNDLRRRVDTAEANVSALKDLQQRCASAEREVDAKNVELAELRNKVWTEQERAQRSESLQKRLDSANEEVRRSTKEAARQREMCSDLRVELKKKEEQLLEAERSAKDELSTTSRRMKNRCETIQSTLDRTMEETDMLRGKVQNLQDQLSSSKLSASASIQDAERVAASALRKIESLTQANQNALVAKKEMQDKMVEMQVRLGTARQEALLIRQQSDEKQSELAASSSHSRRLEAVNEELRKELEAVQEDFREFLSRSTSLMSPQMKSIMFADGSQTKRLLRPLRSGRSPGNTGGLLSAASPSGSLTMSSLKREMSTPIKSAPKSRPAEHVHPWDKQTKDYLYHGGHQNAVSKSTARSTPPVNSKVHISRQGSVDIAMGDGGADVPAGERHHLDVQLAENYNKDLKEGEKLSIDR